MNTEAQNQADNNTSASADTSDAHEAGCDAVKIVYTIDPPLPEVIENTVKTMLHMAGHVFADGENFSGPLFAVIDENGDSHLLDGRGAPDLESILMWVGRYAAEHDGVAIVTMMESYTLPEAVSKEWAEGGRPEGMKVGDHPDAIDSFTVQVETLKGTWIGTAKVTPYVEAKEGEDEASIVREPRSVEALHFTKQEDVGGRMTNLLMQNKLAKIPPELRGSLERLLALVKAAKADIEGDAEGEEAADDTGSGDTEGVTKH